MSSPAPSSHPTLPTPKNYDDSTVIQNSEHQTASVRFCTAHCVCSRSRIPVYTHEKEPAGPSAEVNKVLGRYLRIYQLGRCCFTAWTHFSFPSGGASSLRLSSSEWRRWLGDDGFYRRRWHVLTPQDIFPQIWTPSIVTRPTCWGDTSLAVRIFFHRVLFFPFTPFSSILLVFFFA